MISVLLDFSKAFDTVQHGILLRKMECMGIRGEALDWFSSYLSNRSQYVNINGVDSSIKAVTTGVHQGSTLGPLLFLLYINDMSASINELQ